MLPAILHGIILAFGLILPLGVQNVFVFNQGVSHLRFIQALPVVVTAALCDTLLISLAVLGVSVIVLGVPIIETSLMIVGTLFLLYMGYLSWKSTASNPQPDGEAFSTKKQIVFACSVSLLNPHAIMDTIGVIGTSSLTYTNTEKVAFTMSCIAVSWLWFFSLALIGNKVGKLDNSGRFIVAINKASAILMVMTALYLAYGLLTK
ncbi:LysE/ArgO family amino acid transporter [Peribacillus alkalitolerans]|uniref:LysE/ArgO family amino acid transporter n=1 Tax=Peribacillus alkalitolerans TaxID=1550385 RepID=UPI0013CF88EF|nr:LysE/ArgO family amino acid transporter [Peribacillus alkalitolerans]